jgi:hypothetical protein
MENWWNGLHHGQKSGDEEHCLGGLSGGGQTGDRAPRVRGPMAASMPACMGTMAALSLMAVPFGGRGAGGP